jgi:hypothetical protein
LVDVKAVVALTKREGESYPDFIRRVRSNGVARLVKIEDLNDNLDPSRLGKLLGAEAARLEAKYTEALMLEGSAGTVVSAWVADGVLSRLVELPSGGARIESYDERNGSCSAAISPLLLSEAGC